MKLRIVNPQAFGLVNPDYHKGREYEAEPNADGFRVTVMPQSRLPYTINVRPGHIASGDAEVIEPMKLWPFN